MAESYLLNLAALNGYLVKEFLKVTHADNLTFNQLRDGYLNYLAEV